MHRFLLVLLACFMTAGCSHADVDFKQPLELKFKAVDGREVDLAKLRGKVVIIDFWATWCLPCVIIGPDLRHLYDKYHSQGLELIGISDDSDKSALQAYLKKEAPPWPQYFDEKGDQALLQKLGVNSFPTLWLVNRQGVVIDVNFRQNWAGTSGGISRKTSAETLAKLDAVIEKQLKAR